MTDAGSSQPTPPLGVGSLISESFSILLSRFFQVITIGFVPGIIGVLISGMLVGYEETTGLAEPQFTDAGDLLAHGVSFIVNMVIYSITTALLVQLAYDTKLQRPVQIGRYFGPALSAVIPLAILSIVATTLAAIAAMAFIVPGLWVAAVFSVLAPAIVIERVGFGGLSRSAALTKEFRWPIVGAMLLMIACAIVINIVAGFFIGLLGALGGIVVAVILFTALTTIGTGLYSILIALIYARLREIKEGIGVDQIAAVFD